MKALIFNSGIGKRMGELTAHCPKSMVHLYNNETIFERQLRLIQTAGIKDVIITTGPYEEMFKEITRKSIFSSMNFTFVHNEVYDKTNYIYSLYKCIDLIDDDFITLHGDLVFDNELLSSLLSDKRKNLVLINKSKKKPEKDFKGRIINNHVVEVGINIFDDNCFALQPIYKLEKNVFKIWLKEVDNFVKQGNTGVYAENAFNVVSKKMNVEAFSYRGYFVDEIDNQFDLARVSNSILKFDASKQIVVNAKDPVIAINNAITKTGCKRPLFVVDGYFKEFILKSFPQAICFSSFTANPKYEEIVGGICFFKKNNCDGLISFGGGSCIDVAKSIKLYLNCDFESDVSTFKQHSLCSLVPHICIPTTSGTGSESTKHAVCYYNGKKQSICNAAILPNYVILCPNLIVSAPQYQKICTSLDALCQCIESTWAKGGNKISRKYAYEGIKIFITCYKGYLNGELSAIEKMQKVANLSGKAINIGKTTAAHALSYKISSIYNIPHGHAVAMCMNALFNVLSFNFDFALKKVFDDYISESKINLRIIDKNANKNIKQLAENVNTERLSNFPFAIKNKDIVDIYKFIILTGEEL